MLSPEGFEVANDRCGEERAPKGPKSRARNSVPDCRTWVGAGRRLGFFDSFCPGRRISLDEIAPPRVDEDTSLHSVRVTLHRSDPGTHEAGYRRSWRTLRVAALRC